MKFIIYKDKKKEFRWRLLHRNGKIIADSGEGYKRKSAVRKGILNVCDSAFAEVIDETLVKKAKTDNK